MSEYSNKKIWINYDDYDYIKCRCWGNRSESCYVDMPNIIVKKNGEIYYPPFENWNKAVTLKKVYCVNKVDDDTGEVVTALCAKYKGKIVYIDNYSNIH